MPSTNIRFAVAAALAGALLLPVAVSCQKEEADEVLGFFLCQRF